MRYLLIPGQVTCVPSPYTLAGTTQTDEVVMNRQVVKWCLDLGMGIAFLVSFITGFFKFTYLMRISGLVDLVLPLALMSDIHDWAGLALGFFVAAHLFLNRAWIIAMTRKIIFGAPETN
jgi:hypothetical protein